MTSSAVFIKQVPRQPLAQFVDVLWYCDGYLPAHARERRLPTGTVELIFNLRDDSFHIYDGEAQSVGSVRGPLLCGPRNLPVIIDTACQQSVIGVHFKAGGTLPFLDVAAHELCNAHVSLADIWGTAAEELRQRLLEARAPQAKLAFLEAALLARAVRRTAWHPAIAFALRAFQGSPARGTVGEVAHQAGISQRRFIQLFREEVGLTPKLFCRLRRFQDALDRIQGDSRTDWTSIALSSGYFDQAHLIRDFREFSGLSPAAYLRQRGQHLNHVPLSG